MTPPSPYHAGELAAQARAGLSAPARHTGASVGSTFPAAAAAFLAEQPVLVVGAADPAGRVWAGLLQGSARPTGPSTLEVDGRPVPADPLADVLARPARVGLVALQPATRRRIRVNGRCEPTGAGLRIQADQVYANCPKYIQQRTPQADPRPAPPSTAVSTPALTAQQQAWVASADTFFVATRSAAGDADASHRGGAPGFVQVVSGTELRWPDYAGNAMLMTLGNLQQDPAAGLLLVDWDTGATLQLTGTATVEWDAAGELPGAERVVRFVVREAVQVEHASPLTWSPPAYSRHNPAPLAG